ncbi:uncharacterized protein LOC111067872 [Drosophila obscura]|uniref:uncharacterized protein LOC111067872 n=1 Tax=Drosophila obscura TaxID=7282 RepID=UPI001BB1DE1A|nr:uncharacterized protein LOC111067872 [Drosophila obscura]
MSCISSNFSSFFLNSLNDPSEFSKYLSNGELKCTQFEEFQVFGCGAGASSGQQQSLQQQQLQQQQLQYSHTHLSNGCGTDFSYEAAAAASSSHTQRETCLSGAAAAGSSGSGNPTTTSSSHSHPAAAAYVAAEAGVAAAPTSAAAAAIAGAAGGSVAGPSPGSNRWPTAVATPNGGSVSVPQHFDGSFEFIKYLRHSTDFTPGTASATPSDSSTAAAGAAASEKIAKGPGVALAAVAGAGTPPPPAQSPVASAGLLDLDTSTSQKSRSASRKVAALLSSVSRASNSLVDTSSSALDVFDHDSKQTIFDLQHMASNGSSNSNESSLELLAFPNSHLNASNSNTSSEGAACGSAGEFGGILTGASSSSTASSSSHAPKLLGSFVIKENFEVHPSHKVEEGIFQHMNKLPSKKKDTLKQLGVRFTGQMTLTDKSIVVENFIKFCEEYEIKDHRPWLSLNQCGLNKPEQIKFARYLGQGLPTFTLFCIYSNYKNLFCTKRTEIYTKDGYNLPYILDKTKRFLANTTADLKNMAAANDGSLEFAAANSSSSTSNSTNASTNLINSNSNSSSSSGTVNLSAASAALAVNVNSSYVTAPLPPTMDPRYVCGAPPTTGLLPPPALGPPPRSLEQMIIYENFEVHETHRIEDGVCTHISRLPPKKQELLKQFGIQSSGQQCLSNYEKYMLIENFIKFCNEYQISDHRPFLDFHESALSKCEQLKFVRYLGQGLPNLTLNKIYVAFKDLLGNGRPDKAGLESYNLDALLKKKRKNLYNRMHAAAPSIDLTVYDAAQHTQAQAQAQPQLHPHLPHHSALSTPRPHHAFAALNVATQRSEVCNELTPGGLQYSYAGNGNGPR